MVCSCLESCVQELNVLRDLSEEIVKGRDPNISVLLGVRDMSLLQESIFGCIYQCCGSGTRCLFDPGIREGIKNQDPDPGPTIRMIFPRA